MDNQGQQASVDVSGAQETSAPVVDQTQGSEIASEASASTPAPTAEEMIPKSHVSAIVAKTKKEALDKQQRALHAEFEKRLQELQQQSQSNSQSTVGGINQAPTPQQLEKMIIETANKLSTNAVAQQVALQFESKIDALRNVDPEFGDLYDSLNIQAHAYLVPTLNSFDNTAEIVRELASNPHKFAEILMLSAAQSPELAKKSLAKISQSIKANQEAAKIKHAPEPITPSKSTTNTGIDNGQQSVADLQRLIAKRRGL